MDHVSVMTNLLVALLGLDQLRVPGPILLLGFILDVTVASFLAMMVWFSLKFLGQFITDALEIQTTRHRLVIARGLTRHDFDQVRKAIRGWKLLLVRFGSDEYLRGSAGEADRNVGRPRYTSSSMKLSLSPTGEVLLSWGLPVHRRLGTQFRCFIDTRKGDMGPSVLTGMLKHYDEIDVIESEVVEPTRVYFTLRRFPVVTTSEGIRQNLVRPE